MTCSCLAGYCPLCAGVTYRSPLAHRAPHQHVAGAEQRRPVPSHEVGCTPMKPDCADEITKGLRVDVIGSGHHAPDTAGCVMANAEILLSDNRKP